MSHVTYEGGSHVTHERVMPHDNESRHIPTSHAYINESCHMSMSHGTCP